MAPVREEASVTIFLLAKNTRHFFSGCLQLIIDQVFPSSRTLAMEKYTFTNVHTRHSERRRSRSDESLADLLGYACSTRLRFNATSFGRLEIPRLRLGMTEEVEKLYCPFLPSWRGRSVSPFVCKKRPRIFMRGRCLLFLPYRASL